MQKLQDDWPRLAQALTHALRTSGMDDKAISRQSGVNYYAVRRMRLNAATNRSKSAMNLCTFFRLDGGRADKPALEGAESLQRLVVETWDGTAAHRRFLEEVLTIAGRYNVQSR